MCVQLLAFEDEAINQLMEKAIQNGQMLEETTESIDHGQLFGPDLERITVRSWKDAKDIAEQDEEDGELKLGFFSPVHWISLDVSYSARRSQHLTSAATHGETWQAVTNLTCWQAVCCSSIKTIHTDGGHE